MKIINFFKNKLKLKIFLIFINDIFLICLSIYLSLIIRYETFLVDYRKILTLIIACSFIYFLLFVFYKVHRKIHRFFNEEYLIFYAKVILIYSLLLFLYIIVFFKQFGYPRSFFIINPIIFLLLIYINRFFVSFYLNTSKKNKFNNVLIYCSNTYMDSIYNFLKSNHNIIAFIDSSNEYFDRSIYNIPIYSPDNIDVIIKNNDLQSIFLLNNSLNLSDKKQIIKKAYVNKVKFNEILFEKNNFRIKRDIEIGSLFFRDNNISKINLNTNNKNILITGGAGSIGSELCNQLIKLNPKKIIIIDINELGLFNLENKFKNLFLNYAEFDISYLLCNLSDINDIKSILIKNEINYIFHAAAYKHVPILENNIISAFKNNFINTYNLCSLCLELSIEKFILISSDKAVRPTNIMGVTKRLQELTVDYFHQLNFEIPNKTIFTKVRFGNVLESSGSAIPFFKKQILDYGIVTVTHPEITRFFMSIEEAVYLVIQSTSISRGGETYLLDMGDPIKIIDLVKQMISVAGLTLKNDQNPDGDVEIKIIGLRPGEKLYEELLINNKNSSSTIFKNIFKSREPLLNINDTKLLFNDLFESIDKNDVKFLKNIIDHDSIGYKK